MPFTRTKGVGSGRIVTAGDLTAAPIVSDTLDVQTLETISLASIYARGGGSTVTALNFAIEVSYDNGATWIPVAINIDFTTPPDIAVVAGSYVRAVAADDSIAISNLDVQNFELIRFSITVTGVAAAGDLIDVDAFGLASSAFALSGAQENA